MNKLDNNLKKVKVSLDKMFKVILKRDIYNVNDGILYRIDCSNQVYYRNEFGSWVHLG